MLKTSLIIVNYHVKKELLACIASIVKSKTKATYEIIVIDNDEEKTIENELKKKFPQVRYVPNENKGFGQGNNAGARRARGKYLFFLNPDTKIYPYTIDNLVEFLEKQGKVGIVSPLLLDMEGVPYELQGTKSLTPLSGAVALSFINNIFPNNPVSRHYWQTGWDKTKQKEVDVIPGTAFVISKKLYEELHGFDEHFFLYFEEFDLCKRVRDKEYKIFITPTAKVVHLWARSTSTQPAKKINAIFIASRKYYFRKHYGLILSWFVELVATFGKQKLFLLLILLAGFFVRFYRIDELMPFIGDQGWFYLSARDMITSHTIPLVGITSSHTWIHQGPLWTYMLAPVIWFANWHPLAGGYLSIILGTISIWMTYKVGKEFFSEKIGLIAALLFATSPLAILSSRMPYHTAPIPLFTLLFIYSVYAWLKGNSNALPWIFFFLGVLYNLQLATVVLWFVFIPIFFFTLVRSGIVVKLRTVVFPMIAFSIPMLPMFIYDIHHGFPQTLKFVAWIGYKILRVVGFPVVNQTQETSDFLQFVLFTGDRFRQLVYLPDGIIAAVLFAVSMISFCVFVWRKLKMKQYETGWVVTVAWFSISIIGYLAGKTPSDAYLPMLFPAIILVMAVSLEKLKQPGNAKLANTILLLVVLFIGISNVFSLITQNYLVSKEGVVGVLRGRIEAAERIINIAGGKPYRLKGEGVGSEFESFTMNYEYLTWWLGQGPSKNGQGIEVIIQETERGILIDKEKEPEKQK